MSPLGEREALRVGHDGAFKIALTIFITGVLTALGVVVTVLVAFERFEHESSYYRASALPRPRGAEARPTCSTCTSATPKSSPSSCATWCCSSPTRSCTCSMRRARCWPAAARRGCPPGFKVALAPVLQAASDEPMPYVMGDDPERMDDDAVIAARPLRRAIIRKDESLAGYLYLVCHKPALPEGRIEALRSSFALPVLGFIVVLVALTTLLAAWIIGVVTRPLRRLSQAVADVTAEGLDAGAPGKIRQGLARHAGAATNSASSARVFAACSKRCAGSGKRCAGSTISAAKA